MRAVWLFSSLLNTLAGLWNFGSRSLVGLLNSHVARLGKLGPISLDIICNKAAYINVSLKVFLHCQLYQLIHAFAYPLF